MNGFCPFRVQIQNKFCQGLQKSSFGAGNPRKQAVFGLYALGQFVSQLHFCSQDVTRSDPRRKADPAQEFAQRCLLAQISTGKLSSQGRDSQLCPQ